MKRGLWKRAAALALAVMMCLGLAACNEGSDNDDHGGNGDNHSAVGSSSGKTSQPGKENVYSYQELELLKKNDNVTNMVYQDGKLYLLVYNWGGSGSESSEKNVFGCYKANVDGSESSFVELPLPEKEESYSWVNHTLISGGGYIYAVENSSYENSSDPDNYIYEDRYFLNCWDMDGSLLWSKRLDEGSPEGSYCGQLLDGGEGKALVIMGGSKSEMALYSSQGEELSRREVDNGIFERSGMMYTRDDGTLMVTFYNEEYTKRFIASYDIETGTLGEQYELPFSDNYRISKGNGTDLLLTNGIGVYTWSIGDAEPRLLMNIVNSELPAGEMSLAQIIDDRHFVAMYNDLSNWEEKCAYFTYVDPADIPDKEELTLGGVYIDTDIKAKVIEFNKSSDRYRVILKDYSVYNTSEDWTAGQVRLGSDIISGQMPDIMMLTDMNNYVNYVSKGMLADIGELLKADPELGKLEYLQNVWDAYSVNGKLYVVVPSFNVRTMIAKRSLVGEPQSWTMADVEAVTATMPEGAAAFGNMTRYNFINQMMSYAGKDFIDVETGRCAFNSQSFMEMLEFAKNMPIEDTWMYEEDYSYYENQYRENRSLLYDLSISNIKDCKYQIKGYMGEEVSFVGFPSTDSNGSTLSAGSFSFMISAKSDQKEGAWQFVRQFLTEEYQTSEELYSLPVLKSAFLAKAQEAKEPPYWTDENGDRQYYDDTWIVNGEEIILEPFTQEEIDRICEFIYTVNRTAYYNDDIYNIIVEEADAFFAGQKNVQEVADIIQSRAQVYVSENS